MTQCTQPDLSDLRSRGAFQYLRHILASALPPPMDDTPEAREQHTVAAAVQVAALCPATVAEAMLAAQYVAASVHALDCLRLARAHEAIPLLAAKCRAQSLSMMRQSQSALRALQALQADRRKRDANQVRAEAAAYHERAATAAMLNETPVEPPTAAAAVAPPAAASADGVAAATTAKAPSSAAHRSAQAAPAAPRRPAGMPDPSSLPPAEAALLRALVSGRASGGLAPAGLVGPRVK